MKIHWKTPLKQQVRPILEQAGYHFFIDPRTKKESFVMRLGGRFYPRFHLYIKDKGDVIIFDLHLDQKKASYKGQRAHSGEYDGPLVEEEIGRIERWLKYYSA